MIMVWSMIQRIQRNPFWHTLETTSFDLLAILWRKSSAKDLLFMWLKNTAHTHIFIHSFILFHFFWLVIAAVPCACVKHTTILCTDMEYVIRAICTYSAIQIITHFLFFFFCMSFSIIVRSISLFVSRSTFQCLFSCSLYIVVRISLRLLFFFLFDSTSWAFCVAMKFDCMCTREWLRIVWIQLYFLLK